MTDEHEDLYGDRDSTDQIVEFGHWLESSYMGDTRFEGLSVQHDAEAAEANLRFQLDLTERSRFFVEVRPEESIIRIGMATEDDIVAEAIEEAVRESSLSLTEFLADAMNAIDELEHEVIDFDEDERLFYSDIEYARAEDLSSQHVRDEVVYYLEGYVEALTEHIESAS